MFTVNFSVGNLNKIVARLSIASCLAVWGIMWGMIPKLSLQAPFVSMVSYAYAQDYTSEEIMSYAKAGYQVEILRQQVYKEIKNIINEPPPNIVCNQQETLQSLSGEVRQIAEQYCSESQEIVQQHNLTVDRFNELKQYYDRRDDFYNQVQNILIDLQNQSTP